MKNKLYHVQILYNQNYKITKKLSEGTWKAHEI